jgi:hypothetical protein
VTDSPTTPLPQPLRGLLMGELVKALPLKEVREIASLPTDQARRLLVEKGRGYGSLISRDECDACLKALAHIVPHGAIGADNLAGKFDLYWALLRKHGVTQPMLMAAQERFIMAPRKGKARWFPDPGELFEMCAEEATNRTRAVGALHRALAIIDGEALPAPEPEGIISAKTMREMTAKMFANSFKSEVA